MSRLETIIRDRSSRRSSQSGDEPRVAWFDYAKGICIILVVMMHSTGGTAEAFHAAGLASDGMMSQIVAFAKPFRMPDFFLLSGLFLFAAIDRDWRTYLDRKVVHFVYFYVLWLIIQSLVRSPGLLVSSPLAWAGQLAYAFFMPFPPLWFIYVLPLYFVVTKLARGLPPWLLWSIAGVLHVQPLPTGWPAIDVFAVHYYVYFVTGYLLAPQVFDLARRSADNPRISVLALLAWALANALVALMPIKLAGFTRIAEIPGLSIAVGLAGAMAVVTVAALLARFKLGGLIRQCGANSLVIYVSFMLAMAATRVAIVKSGLVRNVDLATLIVIAMAITVPLVVHRIVRGTSARWLFERPDAARLDRPGVVQRLVARAGNLLPGRNPGPSRSASRREQLGKAA